MNYTLPTVLEVNGTEYEIRSDYRPILDILVAMGDPELSDDEKAYVTLQILYQDWENIPTEDYEEAVAQAYWFIDGGKEPKKTNSPRLMDWEQDFGWYIAPINRIAGQDIRGVPYVHWWTFLSFYNEIGECAFAQIVSIRNKRKRGKKLEKWESEWYRQNQEIVDIKQKYTSAEDDLVAKWTKGVS